MRSNLSKRPKLFNLHGAQDRNRTLRAELPNEPSENLHTNIKSNTKNNIKSNINTNNNTNTDT